MHPRAEAYHAVLGDDGLSAFRTVIKSADCVAVGKGGVINVAAAGFKTAQRCMRCVDTDRVHWAREQRQYEGRLANLEPLECTPKNVVLLMRPLNHGTDGPAQPIVACPPVPVPVGASEQDSMAITRSGRKEG
jgi:hypothetical protein